MNASPADVQTKALDFISNAATFSLIATMALLAWVASGVEFASQGLRLAAMASLTVSVSFGVGTLALVPLIQEARRPGQSNFDVDARFRLFGPRSTRLKTTLLPQYAFLVAGTVLYIIGMIN